MSGTRPSPAGPHRIVIVGGGAGGLELATRLGDKNAMRAVGLANGRNPIAIVVPCHRVIGADGSLTGYGGGLPAKRWLLAHEQGGGPLFASRT